MNLTRLSFLAFATALLLAACGERPADDGKVIATVNGVPVTEKELEHFRQIRQSQNREPAADKEKERKQALDEMVDRILLAQRAREIKLSEDPETAYLLRRVNENILVQAMFRKAMKDSPITDEDMKKRFQQEVEATHKTEYKARHILVKSEDEANALLKQIKGGGNFVALAKNKSLDTESGRQGGDLGWINQGMGFVPEFFNAVTQLKKGETSAAPVKSEFGWHIVKVEDTRPLKLPTFEEFMVDKRAHANLQRRLQDERLNAMAAELKAKAKIEMK